MRHAFPRSVASVALRMLRPFTVPALLVLSASLTGCSDDGGDPPPRPPGGDVIILPSNNYTSVSSLTVQEFETAPGDNIDICWTDLVQDVQGHDATAASVKTVFFIRVINDSQDEVDELLNTGVLGQEDADGYWYFESDGSTDCASLEEFKSGGDQSPLVAEDHYADDDQYTYLVLFAAGNKIGFDALSMLYLVPTPGETVTDVNLPAENRFMLEFEADLHSADKLVLPADEPSTIDWTAITTDNHGNTIDKNAVDRVLLGFYAGKDVAALEKGFLDLDQPAAKGGPTVSWELSVAKGHSANLAAANGRNGEGPFTDFQRDEDGTWILGLFCSTCQNPAPIVVSVLDPQ
jgi:hypothetical protein